MWFAPDTTHTHTCSHNHTNSLSNTRTRTRQTVLATGVYHGVCLSKRRSHDFRLPTVSDYGRGDLFHSDLSKTHDERGNTCTCVVKALNASSAPQPPRCSRYVSNVARNINCSETRRGLYALHGRHRLKDSNAHDSMPPGTDRAYSNIIRKKKVCY